MMKKVFCSLAFLACAAQAALAAPSVQAVHLELTDEDYIPCDSSLAAEFPKGMPLGIGSSLAFVSKKPDGSLVFLGISDRGPNGDTPLWRDASGALCPTKMFPSPDFTPTIATITVKGDWAKLSGLTPIRDEKGQPISGRPVPAGLTGSTGETALDVNLSALPFDVNGLDTEGIDIARDGSLWICDEYGPFILHLDSKGRTLEKYGPGSGLPEILARRQINRGFEGLCVLPSGKIAAVVQSILDLNGKVKKSSAPFVRLIVLDPTTKECKTFAYPIDATSYKKNADAKIGDLAAAGENRVLLIEQGAAEEDGVIHRLYAVDLSEATDITGVKAPDGRELETLSSLDELTSAGIRPASKKLLADLNALGWKAEKAEGLAVVDDKTVAICSDNDFGMTAELTGVSGKSKDYLVSDGKVVTAKDLEPTGGKVRVTPTGEETAFWLVTFDEPIR